MVVLGLETATRAGSLALVADGATAARRGDATRTHGERLPGEILAWLTAQGRSLADVDLFAVIAGPGSFTGLRVGMATLQGLVLPGTRRVVPVPTLDAVAAGWIDATRPSARTLVVACLDGQRGDIFFAGWETADAAGFDQARSIVEARVGRPPELAHELTRLGRDVPIVIVGDGADRYADVFDPLAPAVVHVRLERPLAAIAAERAAAHPELAVGPHALRPIYVRRPDAVLARERARGTDPPRTAPAARAGAALSTFRITRATSTEDLGDVEVLQRRTFTNPWAAEAMRWELERTDVARLYLMRERQGGLVGYCACWMIFDELHINSLAVDEAWRRQGAARHLLDYVFREAVAAGVRSATLEVRQSNLAARALYEGLGFQVEAVRRDYYREPREDALILWHRHLGAT
jgi:tRNA threonylcarbamoyladenosine biosynthesis protein TsaB